MQGVHEVREQVVEHTRKFCPTARILVEELNPFQTTPEGTLEGDQDTSVLDTVTLSFLFFFLLFSFFL